jgi:hypothetical protein
MSVTQSHEHTFGQASVRKTANERSPGDLTDRSRPAIVTGDEVESLVIDREAVAVELADLNGSEQLIADLEALVEAGLIEERQSISATRFKARVNDDE